MFNISIVPNPTQNPAYVTDLKANDIQDLANIICYDSWTPGTFKKNHRSLADFIETQLMVLDIDSTRSLSEAKIFFNNYMHIIATTKSHQVLKNNIVADRYRVVLFLDAPCQNPADYKATYKYIESQWLGPDPQCAESARFFYPCVHQISINDVGAYFPLQKAQPKPVLVPQAVLLNMPKSNLMSQASNYIKTMPPSIQGENGSLALWNVSHKLIKGFNLSQSEAMIILNEYNQRCEPPWSESELRHKLDDAENKSDTTPGYILSKNLPKPSVQNTTDFPLETLPNTIKDFVLAVSEEIQVPEEMVSVLSLGSVSSAVAKNIHLQIHSHWSQPLNIFTMVSMDSASRKSSVFDMALKPVRDFEEQFNIKNIEIFAKELHEYKSIKAQYEKAFDKSIKTGESTDKENASFLCQKLANTQIPVKLKMIVDDITTEELGSALAEQGRIAMFVPEGMGALSIIAGRYNNSIPNFDIYLKAHNGETINIARRGRSEYAKNPALTIIATIQPKILTKLADNESFLFSGLLARFLFCTPKSLIGERKNHMKTKEIPQHIIQNYTNTINFLLNIPVPKTPHILKVSLPANVALAHFEDWVESKLNNEFASIEASAGKMHGQVARIAGLLHCAKQAEIKKNPWETEIDQETMDSAILVGKYFLNQALELFGNIQMSNTPEQKIKDKIKSLSLTTFSRRELHQKLRWQKMFEESSSLDTPLANLIKENYLKIVSTNNNSVIYEVV